MTSARMLLEMRNACQHIGVAVGWVKKMLQQKEQFLGLFLVERYPWWACYCGRLSANPLGDLENLEEANNRMCQLLSPLPVPGIHHCI